MKRHLATCIAAFLLFTAPAWAAQVSCDSLPSGSMSRMECEKNAARIKALPGPDAGVSKLGQSPPGGVASVDPDTLCGSVNQYVGRTVVLRGLQFNRLLSREDGTFKTPGGREILVSGLPSNQQFTVGEWYDLTVRPLGVSEGRNAYGGPVVTPHALYLGLP